MSPTPEDVIREHHEAEHAYRVAFSKQQARDDLVALPADVRDARAALEVEAEAERLVAARIAADQLKADREERWIAAHEDLAALRGTRVN